MSISEEEDLKAFHTKFGFPLNHRLDRCSPTASMDVFIQTYLMLQELGKAILPEALIQQKMGDERLYRLHLIIEEAGELAEAFCKLDKVETADALGDLLYVTIGTAVTYGMPLTALFNEIHASNMSKTRDPNDPRMRGKDPARGYFPPNIRKVLDENQ